MMWAVFLDRDGTINKEVGYLDDPHEWLLLPGAAQAIRLLNQAGVPAILVTNQSALARGYISPARLSEIHTAMADSLAEYGAYLDAIYYCPHHPDEGCRCRKPQPGMLQSAAGDLAIDLERSFLVGDKLSDLEAGRRARCRVVLVLTGLGGREQARANAAGFRPDHTAPTLLAAVDWILAQSAA